MDQGREAERLKFLRDKGGRALPISLVSDEPADDTCEIGLGMQPWADILAGVAVGTEGPFTIGLFAPWGQGKTSVLRRACALAGYGDNVHTFVVNAWEHERHSDPLPAILEDILRAIDAQLGIDHSAEKYRRLNALKRILTVLVLGGAAISVGAPALALMAPGAADVIGQIGAAAGQASGSAKSIKDEVDRLPEYGGAGYGTGLRAYLEQAKRQYLPDDKVIVFIDDLDRCQPDKAVLLLESIKHLLWVPGFVFVLALDNVVLERYLQHRYENEYGLKHDPDIGKRYLEKLVQLTIFLPESETRFEEYIAHLLDLGGGQKRLPEKVIPILVAGAKNNPRNLKRRINDLIVDRIAYQALGGIQSTADGEDDALICLAVHRLLRDILLPDDLRSLLGDEQLQKAVFVSLEHSDSGKDPDQETLHASASLERVKEKAKRITDCFRTHHLEILFINEGIGRVWFVNSELRNGTRAFLKHSRPSEAESPIDQEMLVNTAVRARLGLPPKTEITNNHRFRLKSLDLSGTAIDDRGLRFVAQFPGMSHLNISLTKLTDVSPLQELKGLESLFASESSVRDVSTLSSLTRLRYLDLSGCSIADIAPLAHHPSLKSLSIASTRVHDLSPLSDVLTLKSVMALGTPVVDISALGKLHRLEELDISLTNVANISALANCKFLIYLDLENTQVDDLTPLIGLENLQTVVLPDGGLWEPKKGPIPAEYNPNAR